MDDLSELDNGLLSRQQPMQNSESCPTNVFTRFGKEEVEQSITDRFEKQVARYPDRVAVRTDSHELTYDALNKAANRVAQAILAQRGEGEEPIALLGEQGAVLLAEILGVLKAGKIYVPLDPLLPHARFTYILEDSQASLIVTNNENLSLARKLTQDASQLINFDEMDSSTSDENPGLSISPDTLSYILYTSGSTGQPKGIIGNHRNVLHEAMNRTNEFRICPDDRMCIFQSFSFAGSVWKIFPILLNGASLHPLDVKRKGMSNLANWLIQEEITILGGRAVIRELFTTLTGAEEFPRIRIVTLGGDSIYRKDIELARKFFSPDFISTGMGGSEFGAAARYAIHPDMEIRDGVMPIGYAVEDKKILILDEDGMPVGPDQVGEIAIKSRYLSPGYWRKPDLTQARFLPDPAGRAERIYLTGDMGRMTPDGCVYHMGRKDFQVKIRGYRVEIGEVEAALLDIDTVNEAAVVMREDQPGDKRLVAYIVPNSKPAPTISELRRAVAGRLPDYMIPSAFVMLDEMPRTATDKINRRALPAPDTSRPELENPFVAPRTPVEEELTGIWSQVLGIDQVGIHDNFLELGGHSLLATQIISRIVNTFRVKVPLQSFFKSPTVADMAIVIVQDQFGEMEHEDVDRILTELEALSDEELRQLLANEEGRGGNMDQRS